MMKVEPKRTLKLFLIEILLYSVLIIGYFALVLHLLGDWLFHAYEDHRRLYAAAALVLVLAQGFLLETVTRYLLGWVERRAEVE